jgi:hypothetical protein
MKEVAVRLVIRLIMAFVALAALVFAPVASVSAVTNPFVISVLNYERGKLTVSGTFECDPAATTERVVISVRQRISPAHIATGEGQADISCTSGDQDFEFVVKPSGGQFVEGGAALRGVFTDLDASGTQIGSEVLMQNVFIQRHILPPACRGEDGSFSVPPCGPRSP